MQNPARLPLSNHCLYDGHDVDDAREVLSKLFTEIALDPLDPGHAFRAQVNGARFHKFSICYLRFENGAVAGPVRPLDFHTLQLNPTGSVIYNTDDGATGGDAHRGVMLSAGQTVRNRHSPENGNLALIVSDDVLREHLSKLSGKEATTPLKFAAGFDLTNPRVASLLAFIDTFTRELDRPGGICDAPAAIAGFEDFLLTSLVCSFEHNHSDLLEAQTPTSSQSQVQELEEFIAAHASEPISMATLTEMSGLSTATIFRTFKKHRSYTPMQFLLDERMRLVRQRLLFGGPMDSVSRIAMDTGFVHMGRFAAEYHQRYREYPSQTLNRTSRQKAC